MAKTLEKETVAAIEQAILTAQKANRHPDLHGIAAIFNTTYQSVCYIRRRIEKLQRTGVDDRKKSGRKPMPEEGAMIEAVRALLLRRPELDQSAVSDYLFDEFGVRLCQATVSRIYKKNGIPHKVSNKLYKKSKLFTMNPDKPGRVVTGDMQRAVAVSALFALPPTYRSPYAPVPPVNPVTPETPAATDTPVTTDVPDMPADISPTGMSHATSVTPPNISPTGMFLQTIR